MRRLNLFSRVIKTSSRDFSTKRLNISSMRSRYFHRNDIYIWRQSIIPQSALSSVFWELHSLDHPVVKLYHLKMLDSLEDMP